MESAAPARPVVGLVGSEGAYGRWLRRFFAEGMGLEVIGRDPADRHSPSVRELVERADVLVFAAPIRHTPARSPNTRRRPAASSRAGCGWTSPRSSARRWRRCSPRGPTWSACIR